MKKSVTRIIIAFFIIATFFISPLLLGNHTLAVIPNGGQTQSSQPGGSTDTQASNCVVTAIGNPPKDQPLPAGCGGESAVVQKVIAFAKAHLKTGTYIMGTPSRDWGSDKSTGPNDPPHFDCSGFVAWAWYWGSGGKISMLGQTNADWADTSNPHYEKVVTTDESQLQPGDLVYFNDHLPYPQPFHVGLFVGKDTCGQNDCFLQYYSTGYPGDEESIKVSGATMMGYIRIKNP